MYIHEYYVYYCLPFQEHTASAWGVDICEPLIILLHIQSISKYLDGLGEQHDVVVYMCGHVYVGACGYMYMYMWVWMNNSCIHTLPLTQIISMAII